MYAAGYFELSSWATNAQARPLEQSCLRVMVVMRGIRAKGVKEAMDF